MFLVIDLLLKAWIFSCFFRNHNYLTTKIEKKSNHELISPNFLLAKKSPISPRIAVACTV